MRASWRREALFFCAHLRKELRREFIDIEMDTSSADCSGVRLAAGDATTLPGWDENQYADSRFGLGNFGALVSEIGFLREANLLLLRRIAPNCWDRSAEVDGGRVTVRAIAWIAAGHLQHHLSIVEKRCGTVVARSKDK